MKTYPWHIRTGAALSQLINAALFGGHMNETLSARADREQHTSKFWRAMRVIADALFGDGHCHDSREEDIIFACDILEGLDE